MQHEPTSTADVLTVVAQASADKHTLEVRGGHSKGAMWARGVADAVLDLGSVRGVIDYDPDELILRVHAGTPLHEVEAELATRKQMLAFEPFDHAPLFGAAAGHATIGGVVAANVTGSRRISAGAARDHVLGFEAVSGRAQVMKGGGAVVKNVTGFDLPKLMAGSLGTLAVLTAVTLRVLPKPETESTVIFRGLSDQAANALMGHALGQSAAVSGAAHIPGDEAITALRLEGFGPSVAARCREVRLATQAIVDCDILDSEPSAEFWAAQQRLETLPVVGYDLWRVSVPPARGATVPVVAAEYGARWRYDWAGGVVWIAVPNDAPTDAAARLIAAARKAGGYAQLLRATSRLRVFVAGLQSVPRGLQDLQARVKAAFDPLGILNPGLDPAAAF